MKEKKISEELRHCLEGEGCGDCAYHDPETKLTCRGLLQKAYERIKEYEEMEDRKNISKLNKNVPQELSYIKQLANSCENEAAKNNIIVACDSVLKMCNDTFNGYCRENLELYRRLQEYGDLEEQGKLLKLHCVRGDTIWFIKSAFSIAAFPIEAKITSICGVDCDNDVMYSAVTQYNGIDRKFKSSDIGKTVFLTKPEADAVLEEMQKGSAL